MVFARVKPRPKQPPESPGVYASLDELIRLQFKAQGFSFLPRQPIHSVLSGRHASRLRGRGLNFEELRNYLPGDDPRSIDWKVTARVGEPFVRVYTEERDRPVMLLVDQRIGMFFGSRRSMKSVAAAEAAAAGAWRVLSVGDRVGAVVFNDTEIEVIAPHRSQQRVMQILKQVVRMNHALHAGTEVAPNPGMLNEALERVGQFVKHDGLVCLVTDGYGIDEQTRRLVTRLSQHNDVLALFIYDPLEQELPDAGRLVFSDGVGQLEVNTGEQKLRRDFAEDFETRLQRLQTVSRKYAMPLIPLHTDAPVLEQIREVLGYRPGRSKR